ncbi:MAG: MGMT family protein [Planctomycetota bacterium]
MGGPVWEEVYEFVRGIPPGRVMTYGQISQAMAARISPLAVGWALNTAPRNVPWHRVVNAQGKCSTDEKESPGRQQALLEQEGVRFRGNRLPLSDYRWEPAGP